MTVDLHLRVVGVLLIALGLAHYCFDRYFGWQTELERLSLLTRQVFAVHNFFIGLVVVLLGVCSSCYTDALLKSGSLSRIVLSGIVIFWVCRLVIQFAVYDPSIWRGRPFYTAMHICFSIFWCYAVTIYSLALRSIWYS
jgi:xanthine/uracil permease